MRRFTIFPAVDIRAGRAVRLVEGDPERETVYFDDPREAAAHWVRSGARDLHIVDLDAALGCGENRAIIRGIARRLAVETGDAVRVQVGGGVRDAEGASAYLELVHRVVIGTAAVTSPELAEELVTGFGPDRVAVAVDAREGKIMLRGWTEESELDAVEYAASLAERGVRHLIYTDVGRDGTLRGVDPAPVEQVRAAFPHVLVAGGGVAGEADLQLYRRLGLDGAIVGRALYEGRVRYPRAP